MLKWKNWLIAGCLVTTGCTAPAPLGLDELTEEAEARREVMVARLAGVGEALTLSDAMAFALENNLEFRLRAYDAALATGNRKLATMSMLPTLAARAGYRNRDNVQASVSESVDTGLVSLVPSTSTDQESHDHSLEIGWNALDFGLAWFRAREFGEQALIAEEERRRVTYQLATEIVSAWDKAAAFGAVEAELQESRALLDEALVFSEQILARRLRDQVDVIEYRKALLLILRRINRLSQQMDQARDELSRLLGLPAGVPLDIASPDVAAPESSILGNVAAGRTDSLQWAALLYRPEMRQALYTRRSVERDTLRRTVEAFPSLMFSHGANYNSNSYLVNNHWRDSSISLSLNLMKLASLPAQRRLGKLNEEAAAARVELQATAILSQVSIAEKVWRAARQDACLSTELAALDSKRLEMLSARARAAALDRLTVIRSRVDNLLFRIESALDRAEMRRAELMLASSLGVGAVPDGFTSEDIEVKAEEIDRWLSGGMQEAVRTIIGQVEELQQTPGDTGVSSSNDENTAIQTEPLCAFFS